MFSFCKISWKTGLTKAVVLYGTIYWGRFLYKNKTVVLLLILYHARGSDRCLMKSDIASSFLVICLFFNVCCDVCVNEMWILHQCWHGFHCAAVHLHYKVLFVPCVGIEIQSTIRTMKHNIRYFCFCCWSWHL